MEVSGARCCYVKTEMKHWDLHFKTRRKRTWGKWRLNEDTTYFDMD